MNTTPRTTTLNAAIESECQAMAEGGDPVSAIVCHASERLLNAHAYLETELQAAQREVEELKRDKERLDWMDKNRTAHIYSHFKFNASDAARQKTWRLAIDTAMKEEK